ncbi:SRPBCC family protein [Agromyces sp. ZXT2-6]|uniref:SRPBCC family protein n=1 Tax=Agromyces sp. ZXT2-6 TaxID=3461153 RepID=UPI00405508F1
MDIDAQIDAVDRGLTGGTRDGAATHVQTLAQTYPAPIGDVWDALTSAERIPRWFLPVSGDLRLGGRYQVEGNASGTIESCDPPASYGVTWEFGGGVTWLTVRLAAVDDVHTRVELEHVALADDIGAEMWEQFGPAATGMGWDGALLGLALHFTTREVRPDNSAEWLQTDEGRRFQRMSADRWAEAHEASGADAATARRAADTTYAAYTGAPEHADG